MQEIQAFKLSGYCVIPIFIVSEFFLVVLYINNDLNLIGLLTKFMFAVHTSTIVTGPWICTMVYTAQ